MLSREQLDEKRVIEYAPYAHPWLILLPLDGENRHLHLTCTWPVEKQEEREGKQGKEINL